MKIKQSLEEKLPLLVGILNLYILIKIRGVCLFNLREVDQIISSRLTSWMEIVEQDEMFTNEDEYEARYQENEPSLMEPTYQVLLSDVPLTL